MMGNKIEHHNILIRMVIYPMRIWQSNVTSRCEQNTSKRTHGRLCRLNTTQSRWGFNDDSGDRAFSTRVDVLQTSVRLPCRRTTDLRPSAVSTYYRPPSVCRVDVPQTSVRLPCRRTIDLRPSAVSTYYRPPSVCRVDVL